MSNFIVTTRPFLEWASFASAIVLVAIALYGLKQIKLLKIDLLSRSERSAKEKAIEASNMYFNEFIPTYNKFFKEMLAKGMKSYDGPIGDFKAEEFEAAGKEQAKIDGYKRITLFIWAESINRLESIAAYFVTGVADEETGFKVIGRTFVDTIRTNYDILTLLQNQAGKGKNYYSNIIELYRVWAPRFSERELELAKNSIDAQLKNLNKPTIPSLKPNLS